MFSIYAEKLNLDLKTAIKIATPFGGGMARLGETCGAVSGALMAIGLKHGNMHQVLLQEIRIGQSNQKV